MACINFDRAETCRHMPFFAVVVACWDANHSLLGSTETGLQIAYTNLIPPNMSTTFAYL
jgi:hypothetical protein